jgi:valyl-tRNA synthetase
MISWIIEFIKFIRSSKVVLQINPGDFIDINIKNIKPDLKKFFNENFSIIQKVARIKGYFEDIKDKNVIPGYIDGVTFHIKFSEQISLENQLKKIEEKINSTLNEIVSLKTKLNNKNFVKKAPKDIVEAEKNNLKKLNDDLNYLQNIISIKH